MIWFLFQNKPSQSFYSWVFSYRNWFNWVINANQLNVNLIYVDLLWKVHFNNVKYQDAGKANLKFNKLLIMWRWQTFNWRLSQLVAACWRCFFMRTLMMMNKSSRVINVVKKAFSSVKLLLFSSSSFSYNWMRNEWNMINFSHGKWTIL